jgi:hypothetical protein
MASKFESLKKELDSLIRKGGLLLYAMTNSVDKLSAKDKKLLKDIKLPNFDTEYDSWYSEALLVVKQIIPDRYDDFVKQYKNEKRKEVSFLTYGIADYLIGLQITRGGGTYVVTDRSAAIPKMQNQFTILSSAEKRFKSSLFDIKEVLQADIYDSELEAAKDLAKKGFVRGGGAIAGVVLEKHLGHVCSLHNLKTRKKHPSISDFYQMLKDNNIIDTAKWRFIQHLGDLRNLCDHNKDREPTKEDVMELIEGVDKVIKTVF